MKSISLPIQCFDSPGKEREIKNLLRLKDCERIVKYYNYCRTGHSLCIIFELVEGNLEELNCPEKEIVKLCRNVMDGLVYLHSKNVLHRHQSWQCLVQDLSHSVFGLSKEDSVRTMAASATVMHSKVGTRYNDVLHVSVWN